jgi:ATP-dependent Lon protease
VLAARRAGINSVILPKRNEKDLQDVPDNIRKKMKFVFVEKLNEVFDLAIRKEKTYSHVKKSKYFPKERSEQARISL